MYFEAAALHDWQLCLGRPLLSSVSPTLSDQTRALTYSMSTSQRLRDFRTDADVGPSSCSLAVILKRESVPRASVDVQDDRHALWSPHRCVSTIVWYGLSTVAKGHLLYLKLLFADLFYLIVSGLILSRVISNYSTNFNALMTHNFCELLSKTRGLLKNLFSTWSFLLIIHILIKVGFFWAKCKK